LEFWIPWQCPTMARLDLDQYGVGTGGQ
jgi:hypothetical protein